MKILLFVFTFLLMAIAMLPAGAQAQEKLPAEELKYYDAQIDVMLPKLDAFEREYFDLNRRYYQALTSHTKTPEVPTVPDKLTVSPTDQLETLAYFWNAKAFLPEQLAWSISIDTYDGPAGMGYVLNIGTVIYKIEYRKSINYGPERDRSTEWVEIKPDEFGG